MRPAKFPEGNHTGFFSRNSREKSGDSREKSGFVITKTAQIAYIKFDDQNHEMYASEKTLNEQCVNLVQTMCQPRYKAGGLHAEGECKQVSAHSECNGLRQI
jgi:hypothetical protein